MISIFRTSTSTALSLLLSSIAPVAWANVNNPNGSISTDSSYNRTNFTGIDNWQPMIDTTATSVNPWNRMVFIDDQTVPTFNPAFDQGDVHSHLAAYFEPGTKRLKLGPSDFIYLTELSNFSQGHSDTDMQDLVILVTFTVITTP